MVSLFPLTGKSLNLRLIAAYNYTSTYVMKPNIATHVYRQSLMPLHAHKGRFSLCSAHRNDSLTLLIPSSGTVVRSCDRQARVKDKKRRFRSQLSRNHVCVVAAGASKAEGQGASRVSSWRAATRQSISGGQMTCETARLGEVWHHPYHHTNPRVADAKKNPLDRLCDLCYADAMRKCPSCGEV